MRLTNQQKNQYQESGFVVVSGLFDPGTAKQMINHYMTLRAEGSKPGDFGGTADQPDDPTHKYPRMINMHDWDELSKGWAMQAELLSVAEQLINLFSSICRIVKGCFTSCGLISLSPRSSHHLLNSMSKYPPRNRN